LVETPDKAEWAYVMHLAGLIMLHQLPEQDEKSSDMSDDIMQHVDIISSSSTSALSRIRQQLSIPSEEAVLHLPLRFAPECSLVKDEFTDTYYLIRDGALSFELEKENASWRIFLSSIDQVRSAHTICQDERLDIESIVEYLRISFQEGILLTDQTAA
jgi:hypothetical protein